MARRAAASVLLLSLWLAACTALPDDPALRLADQRDGDSFVASDGVEYRIGLINTPELSECGGRDAARRTAELLAEGFTADVYAQDRYGRQVARILSDDGDVGVLLAAEGFADDRYLDQFRDQHPAYAAQLEVAFAAAARAGRGLWQTCWADSADPASGGVAEGVDPAGGDVADGGGRAGGGVADGAGRAGGGVAEGAGRVGGHGGRTGVWTCHPAYAECLPTGPDLDCRDVGHRVRLLGTADPFRLDGNSTTATDGVGCDTFDPWSPDVTYPYYGRG